MKNALDETKINGNFVKYIQRLEKYNCYSQRMIDELGDKLKYAPYSLSEVERGAYPGGMVDVVMHTLCRMGYDINEKALSEGHPLIQVNLQMLMRVLLLQHIGKAELFVPQTEEWKIKKGYIYQFSEDLPSNLRLGERSLCICQRYGIVLAEEEFEAMRSIDRDWEENHIIMASPLCVLTRMINTLTNVELKHKKG